MIEEMFDKDEINRISFLISKNIEYLERYGKTDSLSVDDRINSFIFQSRNDEKNFLTKYLAEDPIRLSYYNLISREIWRSFIFKIKNNLQTDDDYDMYKRYLDRYQFLVSVLPICDRIENVLKCKNPEIENIKAEYSISIFNPIGNKKLNIDQDYKKISSLLNKIYLYYKEALSNTKIDEEFYKILVTEVNSLADQKNMIDDFFEHEKKLEHYGKILNDGKKF